MYYRRKVLFGILETFGGKLSRTQMQKLTFIYTRWQQKKAFDFVPYRFGCYSFQLNQDLRALTTRGFIKDEMDESHSFWHKISNTDYRTQLKVEDQKLLKRLTAQFSSATHDDLITYTYIHYPYYAINSEISQNYLNKEQLEKITKQRRHFDEPKLFTIGYEGISLETYLNKLLINDVRLLCDVRKNSMSMKYGFSKSQLRHACEQVGITFKHIPELGIESNKRKELNNLADYEKLFDEYENSTLIKNHEYLEALGVLIQDYERIAITCFESSYKMCHRGRITKVLKEQPNWQVAIGHL